MDRKQLESMAASNHYMRGLLVLPLAVVLVTSALGNMAWGPFASFWSVAASWVAAAAAYAVALRYYNDTYGRSLPKVGVRGVVGTAAAIVVMGAAPALVTASDLPLNGMALAWAVVALGYYGMTVGLRPHHLAIWGAVLMLALVPLWGDPRTTDAYNFGLLIVAAGMALSGVFDHILLVRTFESRFEPSDARA